MIKEIQIENFRCFKERTIFPLSDLTLVYGSNNCGKTSLLRAFALLRETFSQKFGTNLKFPDFPYHLSADAITWSGGKDKDVKFRITISRFLDQRGLLKRFNSIDSVEFCYQQFSSSFNLYKMTFYHNGTRAFDLIEDHDQTYLLGHELIEENFISEEFLTHILTSIDQNELIQNIGAQDVITEKLFSESLDERWSLEKRFWLSFGDFYAFRLLNLSFYLWIIRLVTKSIHIKMIPYGN